MNNDSLRSVSISQMGAGRFKATNARGGVLPMGTGDDPDFTPVELLLAALAGCAAIEVGADIGQLARPSAFDVHGHGHQVTDDTGTHLAGLTVTFRLEFPDGMAGDQARAALPAALARAHAGVSAVSHTLELGGPVTYR